MILSYKINITEISLESWNWEMEDIVIDFMYFMINQFVSERRLYTSANRKKFMNTISSIPVATKYIIERLKILPDLDSKVSKIVACSNNVKTFHVIQTSEGLDFTRKPNFRNPLSKLLKYSEGNIAKFGGKSKLNVKRICGRRLGCRVCKDTL